MTAEMYRQMDDSRLAEVLAEEERVLQFASFGYDDAWLVGSELRRLARERDHGVTISVVLGEQRVFHAALPGTSADNDAWLENKFRVVARYRRSSLAVGNGFRAQGKTFEQSSRLDPSRYAAHGGGHPLWVGGALAGAVGVSGLEQHDDHALVVEVLAAHAGATLHG